jgi:HEAT repeat protein
MAKHFVAAVLLSATLTAGAFGNDSSHLGVATDVSSDHITIRGGSTEGFVTFKICTRLQTNLARLDDHDQFERSDSNKIIEVRKGDKVEIRYECNEANESVCNAIYLCRPDDIGVVTALGKQTITIKNDKGKETTYKLSKRLVDDAPPDPNVVDTARKFLYPAKLSDIRVGSRVEVICWQEDGATVIRALDIIKVKESEKGEVKGYKKTEGTAETADEQLVRLVAADDEELLAFFRDRPPSAGQIESLIRQLGSDERDEREKASRRLRACGPKAAAFLKAALDNPDTEVQDRARQCLDYFGSASATRMPGASVRLLARRAPPGAVPVLLDFLPSAGDPVLENEVFAALLALTPETGKADRALVEALHDSAAVKRAATAYVLGRRGDKEQTAKVRELLSDKDPNVRLRTGLALLAGRDKEAPPALIELLDGPDDLRWRAEEALRRLAGDKAPASVSGDDAEARRKRRDRWAAWWQDEADKIDPARFEDFDRPLGYTLAVEFNTRRVWECAADGTLRWELRDLAGPMDAQVLPNDRVLVAEALTKTVREYDVKGNVKWEKKLSVEPSGCRRLPNGNTFVTASDRVMEFAPDGAEVYCFTSKSAVRSNAACRLGDGHVLMTGVNSFQAVDVRRDGKWGWYASLPHPGGEIVDVQALAGSRFLLADGEKGRVVEMKVIAKGEGEEAEGKVLWEAKVPGVCGASRTPAGGTLVSTNHKVIELNRDGQVVWQKDTDGYPRRVYRR